MSTNSTRREVVKSLLFRIGAMGFAFVTTAILIRSLGTARYGTWATLTSLLAWAHLTDFGVGYALKNRIASSAQPADMLNLVCGVFQFYVLMSAGVALLFYFCSGLLVIVRDYKAESMILYLGIFLLFPLTIGSAVLQGLRKNSTSALMGFAQSFFWLLSIIILLYVSSSSLLVLSLAYILTVLIIGAAQCILAANTLVGGDWNSFRRLFVFDNLRLAFPLWGIGLRFILLQVTSVILFSLGTYLTYSNLSAEDAAKYDVLFKFFQLPIALFNVLIAVYWTEIARSIAMCDREMLKQQFSQLHIMALGIVVLMLIFSLVVASPFIEVYSGGKIHTVTSDALAFWFLMAIQVFAYAGAVFLNAAENLRGQIIFALAAAALLIPAVLFFYRMGAGFTTVPFVTAILIIPSLLYCNWVAYYHVIKKTGQTINR